MTARIGELEVLVKELEGTRVWQIAMANIVELVENLDDCWQNCEYEKFKEMQVTKRGFLSIINLVEDWKGELEQVKEDLAYLENPDLVQAGDFDNE